MALVVNDRVKETSTTTGTGTFSLGGVVQGFEGFVAGIGNSNTTYYSIVNSNGEFEVGIGTVTDAATDTLSRDTIISSSNSDAAVNFSAGTKDVFCTLPASKAVILDSSGNIVANNGSNLTALNATQLTSGTVPDARFPATLPAVNGSALTNLNASNLASGTVPDARFPATLPAANGSALTDLNASNLASGTVANARLDAQLQDVAGLATTSGKIIQGDGSNFTLSAYTLPTADGSAGKVLTTDGSGAVTFETPTVGDITAVTAGDGLTGGGTTGDVTLNVGAGTGVTVNADDIAIGQDVATSASPTFAGLTTTGDINFADNDKAIFGAGSDLQIYHDGTNSYIDDQGTGKLLLRGSNTVDILKPDSTEYLARFAADSYNKLYYNGSERLETTSAGATVTGTMTATTFSGSGASLTSIPNGALDNSAITINGTSTSLGGSINVGDITGVTAGSGLTGGGTSDDVTLNVGAGTGVTVNADDIAIGQDVATSASPTFAGLTTTADINFGDNDKAIFGAGSDLQIYHDGSHSRIDDTGTGDLILRGNDQILLEKYTGETFIQCNADAGVALYHNDAKKFETTSGGIDVTGTVTFDGGTTSANLNFGDNDKAIFGDGGDLEIYHEGSHSFIDDTGTGRLYLRGNDGVYIQRYTGEDMIKAIADGAVNLYYNNSLKLATTSGGVDVTGTVTFDGGTTSADLNFGDNDKAIFGAGSDLQIYHDGSNSFIAGASGSNQTVVVKPGGNGSVLITNSSGDNIITQQADAAYLHYGGSTKLNTTSGGVDVTGAITATGDVTAFSTSDKSLKKNVVNIDSALDKVSQINGVYYDWTEEALEKNKHLKAEKEVGVIAQDVEKVLPEIVATREDGTKAVKYERLCALLIESVKELKQEIELLKNSGA